MTAPAGTPRWDPEAPSTARMWNYWLVRGTSLPANYGAADEAKAGEIEAACPQIPQMARDARLFSARAVAWAAAEGIAQVLELGAGLPPRPWLHEMARSVRPEARCAYVDRDPGVTDELGALLGDEERDGTAVVTGDLAEPLKLMRDTRLRSAIDPAQPCCLLAVGVLHLLTPARARSVIGTWAALLAPGSVIALTVPVIPDDLTRQRMARAHLPAARYDTGPDELRALLASAGLVPVLPGVCAARHLRPGWEDAPEVPRGVPYVAAAVARKPG